jgi:V/A-type H+-transporting ATPase subunit D
MNINFFPTKGNLILAKNNLKFSRQGYELLDKKRNVLMREIMILNQEAQEIQNQISLIFVKAYQALQEANIQNGISNLKRLSHGITFEDSLKIKSRSVMGVEIPSLEYNNSTQKPSYGFTKTNSSLDQAIYNFNLVKDMLIKLAIIENAAYRLAINIKRTQKRANALKNITIIKFEHLVKSIQESIEEQERDEFTRLKVIKSRK